TSDGHGAAQHRNPHRSFRHRPIACQHSRGGDVMRLMPKVVALGLVAVLAQSSASAQSGSGRPQLHVGTAYSSCYFELHAELTQAEFAEFAGELGAIMRPSQLGDTNT